MKKLIFLATIILASPLWGDGRGAAQTANQPSSGNALKFNGNGDGVNIPDNFSLSNNFTIEGWVRVIGSDVGTFFHIPYTGAGNTSIDIAISGSNLRARNVYNAAGTDVTIPTSSTNVADGNWYHFVTTYDGAQHRLYINGVLEAFQPHTGSVRASSLNSTYIGTNAPPFSTGGNALNGTIDEIRIWNRALTQNEIKQNMCRKLADCADPDLVGYWRFDEGTDNTCSGGQDVCDASCNGNHGTKF